MLAGRTLRWFVVFVFGVLLWTPACTPASSPALTPSVQLAGELTFAGSTTVQPLAAEIGKAFNALYPDVTLDIAAGGSEVGIQAVHEGTVDLGMASRALAPEEAEGIAVHRIAVDVIAVVVHADNQVEGLTMEQLKAIYLGEITSWHEVGGAETPIHVVVRDINSGTRGAFDQIVLQGAEPTVPHLQKALTAGDVAALVQEDPYAVGYVGFGHLEPGLKALEIDGVAPSAETARDGSYEITRPLQLMTGPLSQPLAETFVEFALSEAGQQVVVESGWVPAK
ncbi:MAG: phosphate ABC transporter substrate-binding protein [Anaerolineae bacterium]